MYRLWFAVFTCCALLEQCGAAPRSWSAHRGSEHEPQTDPLQDIHEGQESILSQLLGDYDKVKALSEGSDCRCKCVVRPLSRSACRRIEEGHARAEDFYSVETITSGPECKCACIAPPSAVNPCEGEFRLKKFRETGKENVKLSTILELLEGSFYGMDLLKLHSVTNKLLKRIDNIEKVILVNESSAEAKPQEEGPPVDLQADEIQSPPTQFIPHLQEEKKPHEEEKERFAEEKHPESSAQVIEISPTQIPKSSLNQVTKTGPNGLIIRGMTFYKSEPDPMVADDGEPGENLFEYDSFSGDGPINFFIEENLLQHKAPHLRARDDHPFSIFWKTTKSKKSKDTETRESPSDQVKGQQNGSTKITSKPITATQMPSTINFELHKDTSKVSKWSIDLTDKPHGTKNTMGTEQPHKKAATMSSAPPTTMKIFDQGLKDQAATSIGANPTTSTQTLTTSATASSMATTSYTTPIVNPTAALFTQAGKHQDRPFSTPSLTPVTPQHTSMPVTTPGTTVGSPIAVTIITLPITTTAKPVTVEPKNNMEKHLEKDEGGLDKQLEICDKPHKRKPADCKDTLATISEPVTHNTYGRSEGAWMKDPKSDSDKIYVTNYFYGNNLLEFTNLEVFKKGHFTNSYKLPYNWIGTGHVVYGGAFYYNRAFSRDIIKFDLHHRYVAAWTMLHDAVFEESSSPWEWRSYSDINIAVDESGLWIIYPALDDEGFLQEVVVLSRLNPVDLSMQRETTWRTGLRRNQYGNCFIVCGVLYFVDSYNRKEANLEYAFDTHTNTQMIPRMPFTNNFTYTTQIDYNPKEGVLYAWDNGHQVTYNIRFAYVEP